ACEPLLTDAFAVLPLVDLFAALRLTSSVLAPLPAFTRALPLTRALLRLLTRSSATAPETPTSFAPAPEMALALKVLRVSRTLVVCSASSVTPWALTVAPLPMDASPAASTELSATDAPTPTEDDGGALGSVLTVLLSALAAASVSLKLLSRSSPPAFTMALSSMLGRTPDAVTSRPTPAPPLSPPRRVRRGRRALRGLVF